MWNPLIYLASRSALYPVHVIVFIGLLCSATYFHLLDIARNQQSDLRGPLKVVVEDAPSYYNSPITSSSSSSSSSSNSNVYNLSNNNHVLNAKRAEDGVWNWGEVDADVSPFFLSKLNVILTK